MTKKEFKRLHKNGALDLIVGDLAMDTNTLFDRIENLSIDEFDLFNSIRMSSSYINISDYGEIQKTEIMEKTIRNRNYIAVQTIIDNSKDNQCSHTNIEILSTVYERVK